MCAVPKLVCILDDGHDGVVPVQSPETKPNQVNLTARPDCGSLPHMALLRPAAGPRGCLMLGVDRKLSAYPQNDVNDPGADMVETHAEGRVR
jgi:hypothetical protein